MAFFKAHRDPVPKSDVPLLIIGLGGTGADALLNIKRKFKERFKLPVVGGEVQDKPARTAYLAIDTNLQELRFRSAGEVSLRTSEQFGLEMPDLVNLINNPTQMMPWEKSWWDMRVPPIVANNDAGIFRQVGRLLLFRNANELVQTLQQTIRHLMQLDRADTSGDLNVIIATGISGGTGSGIFLDMAYLIRHVMKNHFIGVTFRIQAYVILPGVNLMRINQPTENQIRPLKKNAFAALKELDYWMNWERHRHEHEQTYTSNITTVWDHKPFDEVVLLGEKKEDGSVIPDAYHAAMDTLSESLLHYFAAEQNTWEDGQFSYLSYLDNAVAESLLMRDSFLANCSYTSIGLSHWGSMMDDMVTYEFKLTFDRVMALVNVQAMVKNRSADKALQQVMPPEENLFSLFDANRPLPAYFNGEPGYARDDIRQMVGEDALHKNPYQQFQQSVEMDAAAFAQERAKLVYERFESTVREYITNPEFGPFAVAEWLNDPEEGLLKKFGGFVAWWTAQADNADHEAAVLLSHIDNTLYPNMVNMSPLLAVLGFQGRVDRYITACQQLYVNKRDAILAKAVAEELSTIERRIQDYSRVILPTFCDLLRNVYQDLEAGVDELLRREGPGTDMISFTQIKDYIDQQMKALADANKLDPTTISILDKVAESSFAVNLSADGKVDGWEQIKARFLRAAESFVNDLTRDINGVSMDQFLTMAMPEASEKEKIEHLAEKVMPNLHQASLTTLKLLNRETIENTAWSFVSIPYDAPIVRAGLNQYSTNRRVVPKNSSITDRICWLKAYYRLPLYHYADLSDLELAYETSLQQGTDLGLHLVQNRKSPSSLHHNWQHLPSPIPPEVRGD